MEEVKTVDGLDSMPDDDFILVIKRPGSKNRLHRATCYHMKSYGIRISIPHTNSTYFHVGRNEEQPLLSHRVKKCKQCFTKQSNQTLGWKTFNGDTV